MLAQREILPYLLERGLVSRQTVVAGELRIVDASRHNRNYRVVSESGISFLIKQGSESAGIGSIPHEATVYRRLREPGDNALARYLPPFHGYDPAERLLILGLLRESRDVRDYHAHLHRFPVGFARQVGEILGTLHRRSLDDMADLPARVPPVLSLHRPPLAMLQSVSGGNLRLIATIQRFPEFCALLDEVHDDWRVTALIHGDARWDNFLIVRSATNRRHASLRLIDLESASRGDPCWDAGSFLSDYLSYWLFSIPVAGDLPPGRLVSLARVPISRVQPAMHAFWSAYVATMGLDEGVAQAWLRRTVRYAAVRLIGRACEQMDRRSRLTGMVTFLLQMSLNMLRRPEDAASQLLSIAPAKRGDV